MGNAAKYCGMKGDCLGSGDKGHVNFNEDKNASENNLTTFGLNTNTGHNETEGPSGAKVGNFGVIQEKNQMEEMDHIGENNNEVLPNGTVIDKDTLKVFEDNIGQIGRFIDNSILDDILKNQIQESMNVLEGFKKNSRYNNKNYFGYVIDKSLIKLNFDESLYQGQWSIDVKRHGFGISIKKDGSRYEGTWQNDSINGLGRFTNINGNYYEGKKYS